MTQTNSVRSTHWLAPLRTLSFKIGSVVGILVLAVVAFRFHNHFSIADLPSIKLRQITTNTIKNPITSAAISPDSKYLAYTDSMGMHLKLAETGETASLLLPEMLEHKDVQWEVVSHGWFPDSTRFLANTHPVTQDPGRWTSETSAIWMVSVLGGSAQKLRENATAYSVSPSGSLISFGTKTGKLGEREIWLMGSRGNDARKLYGVSEDSAVHGLMWSPNGERVMFVRIDESGDHLLSLDLMGTSSVPVLSERDANKIVDASWLPDGRLIYAARVPGAVSDTCNYWAVRLAASTGIPIEKPRQLTNWAGFCMDHVSAATYGKQLVFREWSAHSSVYLADLGADARSISNPKQFNLEDGEDVVADWSSDGSSVIGIRNRDDHYTVYRQSLNGVPAVIATSATGSLLEGARLSPDGNWVILQVYSIAAGPAGPTPLMRLPITGGAPELIFPIPAGSGFSCAKVSSQLCVLAEPSADRKQLIVTAFDPIHALRGKELARVNLERRQKDYYWPLCDLSPDGTRLVISLSSEGPLEILSLDGSPIRTIPVKGLNDMRLLSWTGNGKGLLFVSGIKDGTVLGHLDLNGDFQVLWKCSGYQQCDFAVSPDDRQLAILDRELSANMWMMEGF